MFFQFLTLRKISQCSFDIMRVLQKKATNEVTFFVDWYIKNCVPSNITEFLGRMWRPKQKPHPYHVFLSFGIHQFIPQRGHLFLLKDKTFAAIRRQLKKHYRIYLPQKITKLIIKASSENKFFVKMYIYRRHY